MRRTWILGVVAALVAPSAFVACGARSSLPIPGDREVEILGLDAGIDVADEPDAFDAFDAFDATEDGPVVVHTEDCAEAGLTYIYVVTAEFELFSFNPPAAAFTSIGTLSCPGTTSDPFSMAVDRQGHAYVVYNDGNLFKVSTATAACEATSFKPDQAPGFPTFGMGFSTDQGGPSETLYVAGSDLQTMPPPSSAGIASIDVNTFQLDFIAPFSQDLGAGVELTGTGDDRLFGFFVDTVNDNTAIAEIDKKTGTIISQNDVPLPEPVNDFAFAFWGGDFYLFHSMGAGTTVTRYNPIDQSMVDVAMLPTDVVGVGVSTCAPQQ